MLRLQFQPERKPIPEQDLIDGIQYDKQGRMVAHPDFHPNHGKPFSVDDLEYLCMFYETDNVRSLSYALGKSEHVIAVKYSRLKQEGLVEFYRDRYRRRYNEEGG
ncbi:hypothetical protein J40TS1_00160 [Paenibacillus montaniterrae]|uniref:DNA-entry nuclease n=1 Tax=Paenibacillus montaniterrae TaxID=429341 RepID=A0A919YLH0_9BACL|nr:hypothetical protein J40TS1_00160 [Paenibacillus montaniterrae]